MMPSEKLRPETLRQEMADNAKTRPRDLADQLGVAEADLVAAMVGVEATPIAAAPDRLFPLLEALGEVMALTRNDSIVNENIGTYQNFHAGKHASMVLGSEIDMRMFPKHWVHGFAVVKDTKNGVQRSLQIFDAAGDAVHKIYLRDGSNIEAWDALVAELSTGATDGTLTLEARRPAEPAKGDTSLAETLRTKWAAMTDTHQFFGLTNELKMNRLGANRMVGAPFAIPLKSSALEDLIAGLSETGVPAMVFVGNQGCIQIHSGPLNKLVKMGPWLNIMDPVYNMHLRADHVAEVWLVEKPTNRGAAISVEAFDARGALIVQIFGERTGEMTRVEEFAALAKALPILELEEATS